MQKADLHMHSTVSDGGYTPSELIKKCAEAGIRMVSLTDHDTTEGIKEAAETAAYYGMQFINGIELSTRVSGRSVDILGYGIDINSSELQENLLFHREKRVARMMGMLEKCRECGLSVSLEDVKKEVTGVTWSRPHLAAALVNKGYVHSVGEAFEKYIGYDRPCYVQKEKEMTPEEAVQLIHGAGGKAVVAHPVFYKIDDIIFRWLTEGKIDGVEIYHRDHNAEAVHRFLELTKRAERKTGNRFYRTGGTDFHHESLGRPGEEIGNTFLPWEEAEYLYRSLSG